MNPEELIDVVIKDQSFEKFRAGFAHLSNAERKKLSKTAQSLFRQIKAAVESTWSGKTVKLDNSFPAYAHKLIKKIEKDVGPKKSPLGGMSYQTPTWVNNVQERSQLALFAVAPKSVLMRASLWINYDARDKVIILLSDRNPDWLGEWVNYEMEQEFSKLGFKDVLTLISNGLIEKPSSDAYIASYAGYVMRAAEGWDQKIKKQIPAPNITKQLKSSEILMSDVYNIFGVESMAFNTNSWLRNGASNDYETWPEALRKLEGDGTLDRSRLLDESLFGLSADLKSNQLSGVAKFHKSLKPNADELKQRETDYRALLASPFAPVARLGLDQLSALHKAKCLDVDVCLTELPFIFALPTKTHTMAAIKFARRIEKSNPGKPDLVAGVYLTALAHENTDVQTAAIDGLEKIGDKLTEERKADVADQVDFVAPHLRTRIKTLFGLTGQGQSDAANDYASPEQNTQSLKQGIAELSEQQKSAWGIDVLLQTPFKYQPIASDIMQMRVLHTVEPITPIETQDQLLSAIAAYIEGGNFMEGERLADGISRIPRVADADFKARIKPLLHRVGLDDNSAYVAGGAMNHLIYTYLDPSFRRSKDDFIVRPYSEVSDAQNEMTDMDATMSAHLRALTLDIAKGQLRPRLSMPTHENGWIDPRIWLKRLSNLGNDRKQIGSVGIYDLAQSLIRLAPDFRQEAAADLSGLSGNIKILAAFVLGKTELPALDRKAKFEIWATAARARDPLKDWTAEFANYPLNKHYAGMLAPRNLEWEAHSGGRYIDRIKFLNFDKINQPKKKFLQRTIGISQILLPASMLCQKDDETYWRFEPSVRSGQWQITLFPLYPDALFINSMVNITARIDEKANSFQQVHGAYNAFFQKNRPWGEIGHLVLALGLLGRDADAQGLSLDALIEGTESGQLDPYMLAQTFIKLSKSDWIKLNRPKAGLQQAAQMSRLHAFIISEMLSNWLPHLDRKRRGLSDCLECLLHAASLADTGFSEEIRTYLQGFSGTTKAAKTAKTLLTLKLQSEETLEQIRHDAIVSRINFINPT